MASYGISPLPTAPTIDVFGKGPSPAEIARRAAAENQKLLDQVEFAQQQADQAAAAAKAAADNQALLAHAQAAVERAAPAGVGDYATEAARSAAEGIAGTWDLPERLYTGIKNFPTRLQNAGAFGTPIEKLPLDEPYLPVTGDVEQAMPPAPGWENSWTRLAGNVLGPAIALAPFGAPTAGIGRAAAAAPGIVSRIAGPVAATAARATTTAGVGVAGSKALGSLGEWLGSKVNPDLADMLKEYGSAAGGFAGGEAPGAFLTGAYRRLHGMYADATSARRLADRDLLNIPINTNVLNKAADVRLDATTGIPLAGNRANEARAAEYDAMIAETRAAADRAREYARGGAPPPAGVQDISAGALGAQAIDVATGARENINRNVGRVFGRGLSDRVGRDTVLDPITQNQRLQALSDSPLTDASQRPAIEQFQRDMLDNSQGQIVNPALEQTLMGRRAALAAQVPPDEAAIAAIDAQRAANRGPTWQQQLTQRSLNRDRDTGRPLDAPIREDIRQAQTETLRDAAINAGIPGPRFDAINRRTGELIAQRKSLTPLTGTHDKPPPDTGRAFTTMFGSGGRRNRNRLDILEENNPRGLSGLFGNAMEHKMLGAQTTGGPLPEARTLDPVPAGEWLQSQEPQGRNAIARTPEDMARLDALGRVLTDQRGRPVRSNPGRGSNTLGAPATLYQNPAILATLAGVMSGGNVPITLTAAAAGLLKALTPSLLARTIANRFTNDRFVRQIVHPPNLSQTLDIPRILAAGATTAPAQGRETRR